MFFGNVVIPDFQLKKITSIIFGDIFKKKVSILTKHHTIYQNKYTKEYRYHKITLIREIDNILNSLFEIKLRSRKLTAK